MFGIGRLADQTGCNIETIRFYEKNGLMPSPPRTSGGHRLYNSDHLKRLGFIVQARQLGFSLEQTRNLLSLSEDSNKTCGDALQMVANQLQTVEAKINALNAIKKSLQNLEEECRACCPGTNAPDCTILENFRQSL